MSLKRNIYIEDGPLVFAASARGTIIEEQRRIRSKVARKYTNGDLPVILI